MMKLIFHGTFETDDITDHLIILDSENNYEMSRVYGTISNHPDVFIPSNNVTLIFETNGSGRKDGFELEYQCAEFLNSGSCTRVAVLSN